MIADGTRPRRWRGAIELAIVTGAVTLLAVYAAWRMDFLDARTAHTVRMTDNSRSAYVAKNLVDGNGYTTNDLPAALVDFYDGRDKLHADHWENADRFPFTAYGIALLYQLTGSTSWWVGILAYNMLCWIAFLVILYRLTRTVWGDRYSPLFALVIALLHPYTYMYLYWKDADMLLLTTASMAWLYRYFRDPPEQITWKHMAVTGTLLGWAFLSRPNLGGAFMIFFAAVAIRRGLRARRAVGLGPALRAMARRELVAGAVAIAWILPFAIHSYREWGSPLFSANGIYQLPLGTRFGMGTDTWWKYTEPGHPITLGNLVHEAPGDVIGKFTSSWLATLKFCLRAYAIELFLACGLALWLGRRRGNDVEDAAAAPRPVRTLAWLVAVALLLNLALLPLYSYRDFNWRHYIGFALPLLWLAAGRAIAVLVEHVGPEVRAAAGHVRRHGAAYLAGVAVAVVVWNVGAKGGDGSTLFVRTSAFVGAHWLSAGLVLLAFLAHRLLGRGTAYARTVVILAIVVIARYQPYLEMKQYNLIWFAADDHVADVLRQRTGLVSSLALQGEVAWMSGRKNIPAPELVAHLYSYRVDHHLEIEDVYIESAETLLAKGSPLWRSAPGFEGYARLQRYHGALPGYEVVYDRATDQGDPKYRLKARPKQSTVYRLVDPDAAAAFTRTPARIEIGDPRNVVYTAHGFGGYYTVDGRPVVAATDVTRTRYAPGDDQPVEDSSVVFFVDARRPTTVDLELYAPAAVSLELYWNLDLYAYDLPGDRARHRIGTFTAPAPGWQRIHLAIPPELVRQGVNKLGWKPSGYQAFIVCPPDVSPDTCVALRPADDDPGGKRPARPLLLAGADGVSTQNIAMLLASIEFGFAP